MSRIRKLAMAGGTFGVALSIGFVMQNGDAMAARFGTDVPVIEGDDMAGPVSPPVETPPAMATLSEIPDAALPAEGEAAEDAGAAPGPEASDETIPVTVDESVTEAPAFRFLTPPPEAVAAPEDLSAVVGQGADLSVMGQAPVSSAGLSMLGGLPGPLDVAAMVTGLAAEAATLLPTPVAAPLVDDCVIMLDAAVGQAAMVLLTLSAPCQPQTRVTLHHQGMMFSLSTDAAGKAEVEVPALDEAAIFIASFPDGGGAVAAADVPALANYDRAVLQWQGDAALQLHAREFGAGYGEAGHVWLASDRAAEHAIAGDGGFLTRLGDGSGPAALHAEVYTFPSATIRRGGEVLLTVEAEITHATCDREISAQSIQIRPDTAPAALDLAMTLPGCDAVGDFVVLNTMLENLTLPAR